jgi:poly(beta-D-mannuronate) lyase
MRRILAALVLFGSILSAAPAAKLRSPWDDVKVTLADKPYTCPAAPPFSTTLNIGSYYIDKHASVIDPKKFADFNAAAEGPTHLGQYVSRAADAYLRTGSRAAAECVLSLLDAAAKAGAWTGKMPGFQGVYMQNWELSGTAIPYLKVRNSGLATPEVDTGIRKWFDALAGRVGEYFEAQRGHPGSDAFNNHMYWAGLAVAADGIVNNDREAFDWGVAAYRAGVDAIQPDGSLEAERNRARMAEHYHLYALGALVILAELGEDNGLDLYAYRNGAIHKLVKYSIANWNVPNQDLPAQPAGLEIGWAVPYVRRFPDANISALMAKAQWFGFWQWGGNPP